MEITKLLIILLIIFKAQMVYNIIDFDAIANQDTLIAQKINQEAFINATLAANSSQGERVVRVPNRTFYFLPMRLENIHNVSFEINGRMAASKSIKDWPTQPSSHSFEDFLSFRTSSYLNFHGGGKIDGRGYHWWLVCILNIKKLLPNQNNRPHLMHILDTHNITIHDLTMKNSPQFHLKMDRCYDAELYNLNIKVNTTAQVNLLKKFSLQGAIPLFPLNTDGIDPHGARMHIYNLTVQNYDDVVVPKPGTTVDEVPCTQDMLVQNATVVFGVGMSIGSVPPNTHHNCIRNITFRNVYQIRPLKGIYVKTNPGDQGSGEIKNILYQNFTMDRPIWWAIYIGPQQMKQPDGDGPGCMLYPYDPKGQCTTQPLITIDNITLQHVHIHQSLLFPIIIRCNASNPCTNINFYDVKVDKWEIGEKKSGYICEEASGSSKDTSPPVHCLEHQNLQVQSEEFSLESDSFFQYRRFLQELQRAALQIGYEQEDDEFDYSFHPENHQHSQLIVS